MRSFMILSLSLGALAPMSACTTGAVGVGYAVPTSDEGGQVPDAWRLEGRLAYGGLVKVGLAARTRVTDAFDQVAFAPELSIETSPGVVTVGARAGIHLIELDNARGEWRLDAGSPYLHPLLQIRIGDPVWLFVGGTLEYELRPREEPNRLYLGAQAGVGFDM